MIGPTETMASPYERVIFPVTTGLCLGLLIALWRILRALAWVEVLRFAITALSRLSRMIHIHDELKRTEVADRHPKLNLPAVIQKQDERTAA